MLSYYTVRTATRAKARAKRSLGGAAGHFSRSHSGSPTARGQGLVPGLGLGPGQELRFGVEEAEEEEEDYDDDDEGEAGGGGGLDVDVLCQAGMRFSVPGKHPLRAVFTPRAGDHWLHHGRTPFDPDRQNHLYLPPPAGVGKDTGGGGGGGAGGSGDLLMGGNEFGGGSLGGWNSGRKAGNEGGGGDGGTTLPVDHVVDVTATGYPLRDLQGLLSPYNYQPTHTDVKIHVWSNAFDSSSLSEPCENNPTLQEQKNRVAIGTWPLSPVPPPPSKQPMFFYSLLWSTPHWVEYGCTMEVEYPSSLPPPPPTHTHLIPT